MNMLADSGANCNLSKCGASDFRPDLKAQIVCQEIDDGMGNVTFCQYYAPAPGANNANAAGVVQDGVVSGNVSNVSGV